jgi:hypothetical protein
MESSHSPQDVLYEMNQMLIEHFKSDIQSAGPQWDKELVHSEIRSLSRMEISVPPYPIFV